MCVCVHRKGIHRTKEKQNIGKKCRFARTFHRAVRGEVNKPLFYFDFDLIYIFIYSCCCLFDEKGENRED